SVVSRSLASLPPRRSSDLLERPDGGAPRGSDRDVGTPHPSAASQRWDAAFAAFGDPGPRPPAARDPLEPLDDRGVGLAAALAHRSEEHTSELQSRETLVCR